MTLCFATNNGHKIREVSAVLGKEFRLLTLKEAGISEELPEEQDTLEGNAQQKAQYVFDRYGLPCFADDTGLEVDALNGAPGVNSAHYAGPQRSSDDNIRLLLKDLTGKFPRTAKFRTVIWLVLPHGQWSFEGVVHGSILEDLKGKGGFGYDPVFLPTQSTETMAEMTLEKKSQISHRALAVQRLNEFLRML